jgi:hypothetical protein
MFANVKIDGERREPPLEVSKLRGRKLTEEDIDKKIFRIAPASLYNFRVDNSFVPEKLDDIKKAYIFKGFTYKKKEKLIKYMKDNSLLSFPDNSLHTFTFNHLNDDKWITVEEAINQGLKLD